MRSFGSEDLVDDLVSWMIRILEKRRVATLFAGLVHKKLPKTKLLTCALLKKLSRKISESYQFPGKDIHFR